MDEAILEVERSPKFHLASVALDRSKRPNQRLRKRIRRRRRARRAKLNLVDNEAGIQLFLLCVFGLFVGLDAIADASGSGWPQFLGVAAVLSALAIWYINQDTSPRTRVWSGLGTKRKTVAAAGVVDLGVPRAASRRRGEMVRDVTLRLKHGKRRKVIVDTYMDLHAGDVGIARTVGRHMAAFERMEHLGGTNTAGSIR